MRAWYDIFFPGPVPQEDEPGLRASQQAIEALITRENERGIPNERIVLAGFSQGCAMTLQTGLRQNRKLAGLMGLSGYLPLASTVAAERHAAHQDTPIFRSEEHTSELPSLMRTSYDVLCLNKQITLNK